MWRWFLPLLLLFLPGSLLPARTTLKLAGPDDPIAQVARLVLTEAYRKIEINLVFRSFPAERSLMMSNAGKMDGEVGRVYGLKKKYPNLILVPVAVNRLEAVVFTKNNHFRVRGWESLRKYRVGIRRGTKFAEAGTSGFNRHIATRNSQLFRLLSHDRVHVVVTSRLEGLQELKKNELKHIRVLEPPLETLKLYHYLHYKHRKLLPRIKSTLKKMQTNGRINEIRKKFVQSLKGRFK